MKGNQLMPLAVKAIRRQPGRRTKMLGRKKLEQRARVRLAELAVFDRMSSLIAVMDASGNTSFGLRAQAYWGMISMPLLSPHRQQ